MSAFELSTTGREIYFGPGSLGQIGEAVERIGWRRLMLCSGPSLQREGHISRVESALGNKLAALYPQVQAHVQDAQLAEALALAKDKQIDALIGMGGGSAIGMAKAVSFALEDAKAQPGAEPKIPVIAIPTTYAGSEMTSVYGVTHTDDEVPRKVTVSDPRIAPRLVIYDPDLTLNLPPQMTASSGINALAHCIEALYSIHGSPLAAAAALAGIEHIHRALPICTANGTDRAAREQMLVGAHLAGFALGISKMGLHHGLCHVLGGSAGVPHGIANGVILPHAIRFNVEAAGPQLAQAARAMGLSTNGQPDSAAAEAAAEGVAGLIGRLGLPQRLRDVGVAEGDLPRLAELALHSRAVRDNPRPINDAAQTEAVLRAAW